MISLQRIPVTKRDVCVFVARFYISGKLCINIETTVKLEAEAKSCMGKNPVSAGKQSFGSHPNLPATSQSACQASLLSDCGWQQELAKQRDKERTRDKGSGSFHYRKTLILLLFPPLVLSNHREILWVKVTDIDNSISGRWHNYSEFYYCYWQPHICRRRYKACISHHRCIYVCACVWVLSIWNYRKIKIKACLPAASERSVSLRLSHIRTHNDSTNQPSVKPIRCHP